MNIWDSRGVDKKMKQVLVTVVIPIYNVEQFLEETIVSVLDQYLQDFEVVLVDDGSTDRSQAIAKRYADLDDRISLIVQKNSGVSVARNRGLENAVGEFIYFLDSDDTIDPDFLSSSYKIAKEKHFDLVVVGEPYCKRGPLFTAVPTCGLFIRRELLIQFPDIRFPIGIQPCEDGLFSHKLFALTPRVGINPDATYFYRKHDNQNHVKINRETARILSQIPLWFNNLFEFYSKYDFFHSKALHLARFIEHEPYEIRYMRMPFEDKEKTMLFVLIKEFMRDHVLPYLKPKEKEMLTVPFIYFLSADRFADFDVFYIKYEQRRRRNFKKAMFWVRFIPISSIRRKKRKVIRTKYADL